eukprot:5017558-Prymnesium_polylepis.2
MWQGAESNVEGMIGSILQRTAPARTKQRLEHSVVKKPGEVIPPPRSQSRKRSAASVNPAMKATGA